MNPGPEVRPTRLADGRVNPPLFRPATLTHYFPGDQLPGVEAVWAPAREELAAALNAAGLHLENAHWDWRGKAERVAAGEFYLTAVESEGAVQGLMAMPIQPRPCVLTAGEQLVYVDYLEAAPWNIRVPGREQRLRGVGTLMIAAAVSLSRRQGLGGRVGLHSLAQAEHFYEVGCGMTRRGPDAAYYDLVYFEYTDDTGSAWLDSVGVLV